MNPAYGCCTRQATFHVHCEYQRALRSELDLMQRLLRTQRQRRRKTRLIATGAQLADGASDDYRDVRLLMAVGGLPQPGRIERQPRARPRRTEQQALH